MLRIEERHFANDSSYTRHPSLAQHLLVFFSSFYDKCYFHFISATVRYQWHGIMTKVKHCVQSHTGAYRPKCHKEGLYLCSSCLNSLAIYRLTNHFQAFKERFQKFKLKQNATMQPDLVQNDVEPDLAITKAALWAEHHELVLELKDIETTNSALHARLMAKNEKRLELVAVGKLRDMVHNGPRTPRQ